MKKRLFSILTALALCLCLLPATALAEEITWPETGGTVAINSVEYTYKKDCTSVALDLTSSSSSGNCIFKAGSGYVLWNSTDKKVILHDATITASYALEVPADAQVVVEGANTLHGTSSYALVCYSGGITVTGSGFLSTLTDNTGAWDYAVNAGSGNISIDITGDFTSNGIQAQSGNVTVKSGGAIEVTGFVRAGSAVTVEAGASLSITNTANMAVQSINSGGVSLTAKNGNITVSGGNTYNQNAIQGTNGPVTLDASGEIRVADYNGCPGVNGSSLNVSGTITPTTSGNGTITTVPIGVSTLDLRNSAPTATTEYVITGGGTAKWEPGSNGTANKLTLNGVTMTGDSYVVGVPDNTEIVLTGTNKITATDGDAIHAQNGILKITGEGSLEVAAPSSDTTYALYGASGMEVNVSGALTVNGAIRANDGALFLKSGGAIEVTGSMFGKTSVTVEAGTSLSVTNTSGSAIYATSCNTASLAAKSGNLTVSGTGTDYAYGVYGLSTTELAIHASGTVSVTGQAGSVYGKTLELSGAVAESSILTADQVEALTIPAEKTLTNNGTIKLGKTPATVSVSGTLINNGVIVNANSAQIEPTINNGVVSRQTDMDFTNRTENVTGEGYAWDNSTKTLTLTNYSMTEPCNGPSISLPDGAQLVLSGANTLNSKNGALIEAKGSLDISGSGSLTGTAGGSAALNAQGNVTIIDCTLNLTAISYGASVINTNANVLTIAGNADVSLHSSGTESMGWGVNTGDGGDFTLESSAKLTISGQTGMLIGTASGRTKIANVKIAGTLDTTGCAKLGANLLGAVLNMEGSTITMKTGDDCGLWLYQAENTLTGQTNIKAFTGRFQVATGNDAAVDYYKVTKDGTLGLYAKDSTVTFTAETIEGKAFAGWTATGVTLTDSTNATISFTMPGSDVTLTTAYKTLVSGVSLDKSELSLTVGGTQALTVTVQPSNAENKKVTWSSSDPAVVSVDENGLATAKKAGTATITVTTEDGRKTAACIVTVRSPSSGGGSYTPTYPPMVKQPDEGGAVNISPRNPEKGNKVTVTPKPEDGYEADEVIVTDRSGDPVKVIDNGDGTYSFTQPIGKVTISVTYKEINTSCDGGVKCPSHAFTDLSTTAWYHEAVDYVLNNGMMSGYGNGIFGPNNNLSRAMLAHILYNSERQPTVSGSSAFTDVTDGAWYTNAIIWANVNGIGAGYGNGLFGPNDPITREQLAVMLYRYAQFKGYDTTQAGVSIWEFSDYESISGYAMDAMTWAVNTGIIGGYEDKTLRPQGNATRAVVAQMLKNFLEGIRA